MYASNQSMKAFSAVRRNGMHLLLQVEAAKANAKLAVLYQSP
jgi:hypothetical protein